MGSLPCGNCRTASPASGVGFSLTLGAIHTENDYLLGKWKASEQSYNGASAKQTAPTTVITSRRSAWIGAPQRRAARKVPPANYVPSDRFGVSLPHALVIARTEAGWRK
jgi:hypothetical protein